MDFRSILYLPLRYQICENYISNIKKKAPKLIMSIYSTYKSGGKKVIVVSPDKLHL